MPTQEKITLSIPDMKCEGCAERIQRVLKRQDGVRSADVSLEEKRATAAYDVDRTGPDVLEAAIEKAGYSPVSA